MLPDPAIIGFRATTHMARAAMSGGPDGGIVPRLDAVAIRQAVGNGAVIDIIGAMAAGAKAWGRWR